MKNAIFVVLILFTKIAMATPFIAVQAEEINAILTDSTILEVSGPILKSIKLIENATDQKPQRTYEIETQHFDNSESIKIQVNVEFVPKDPSYIPPPGGRSEGNYKIQVVSKTCNQMFQ